MVLIFTKFSHTPLQVDLSLSATKDYTMKKIILLLLTVLAVSCSSNEKQMETVLERAKDDLKIQLQLPEETKFSETDFNIEETASDLENIGAKYIVTFTVKSQDAAGELVQKKHRLVYLKVGEDGLAKRDYELESFD